MLAAALAVDRNDWLLILVTFHHGLRASEAVQIKANDIQDGFLTVRRLKGSNATIQALVEHSDPLLSEAKALIDLARFRGGNQRLFPLSRFTFFRLMQRHGAAAGLPAHLRHPHCLKHSIAMQTIQSAGVENVRVHLGHKSLSSTGEYLKVSDADAAAAVRRALGD